MLDMNRMRQKGRRRPRGVTPAPVARIQEGPFAAEVLTDVADDDLAISLWLALRFVHLWSITDRSDRWRVSVRLNGEAWKRISRASERHPELGAALSTLGAFRRRASSVRPDDVADACSALRAWAERQGMVETAIHFAEAAAYVAPTRALHANEAGAACRRAGLFERAGIWLMRARSLALRARDKDQRLRALLALGALFKETGKRERAEEAFDAACRMASRRNQRGRAAEAHHDLMLLLAEQGRLDEATDHAEAAANQYPLRHERLPYLAHDFAFVLLRAGDYATSMGLLESFVRTIPEEHVLPALSTFAWAAAGGGHGHRFSEAESRVVRLLSAQPAHEFAPASYIHLAEGARLLGSWERAERHLEHAVDAAEQRGDPSLAAEAATLIEAVRRHEVPVIPAAVPDRRLSLLTRHFNARLRGWRQPPQRSAVRLDARDIA